MIQVKKLIVSGWRLFERIVRAVLGAILKVFKITLTEKQWTGFMQFVKFGLVGVINTAVDYITYLLTLLIFEETGLFGTKAYLVSTILGFLVSFFNMFYWNNTYVFKKKEDESRSALASLVKLFLSYSLTGIIIKPGCMFILVDLVRVPKTVAPIPIMFITIPVNFLLSKLWAFRGKKKSVSIGQKEK